ncbi:MAG: hypothetical protein ABIJ96_00020 [Elusimicrobiota bacterium]
MRVFVLLALLLNAPAHADPACETAAVRAYRDKFLRPLAADNYAYMGLDSGCRLVPAFSEPSLSSIPALHGYGEARFYDVSSKSGIDAAFNPHGVLLLAQDGFLIPALNYSDTRLQGKFEPYPAGRITKDCGVELADANHARFLAERYLGETTALARSTSEQELYKWILAQEGRFKAELEGSANPAYPGATFFYYAGADGSLIDAMGGTAWIRLQGIPKKLILGMIEAGELSINIYSIENDKGQAPFIRHFRKTGTPKMEVVVRSEAGRRRLVPYLTTREKVPEDFRSKPYQEPFDFRRWNKKSLYQLSVDVRTACEKRGVEMKRFPRFNLPLGEVCTSFDGDLDVILNALHQRCVNDPDAFKDPDRYGRRGALFFGSLIQRYPDSRPALCNKIAHSIFAWSHHRCLRQSPAIPCNPLDSFANRAYA